MKKEIKNGSGKTFVENDSIIWELDGQQVLKVSIEGIKLVGEYTTSNGPFIDDWFLIIFDKNSEYYEISMYAENIQKTIEILSNKLGEKILNDLYASAEWKSNILYPLDYKGKEIWNIVEVKPKSLVGKMKRYLGFKNTQLELTKLTEEIVK